MREIEEKCVRGAQACHDNQNKWRELNRDGESSKEIECARKRWRVHRQDGE